MRVPTDRYDFNNQIFIIYTRQLIKHNYIIIVSNFDLDILFFNILITSYFEQFKYLKMLKMSNKGLISNLIFLHIKQLVTIIVGAYLIKFEIMDPFLMIET